MRGFRGPAQGIGRASERGFTLLELIISMALLAVMMAMTYSAFSTAVSAVPRGEDAADRSGRLRMATSIMTRQVRALVTYPAFTDDEVGLFFLQIQGSGTLVFPDGRRQTIGFDGSNGRPYVSIGKLLVDSGRLAANEASMDGIMRWIRMFCSGEPSSVILA